MKRYDIYWVNLDPTNGFEIKKTRPCVIISPDELNEHLRTVVVAPLTSAVRSWPFRLNVNFQNKKGQIALDQIRTIDKSRIGDFFGSLGDDESKLIRDILSEMFCC